MSAAGPGAGRAGSTGRRDVMVVYGTRPEAIKLAPLITALAASPHFSPVPVVTGQHREMLDQVNALFGIRPVADLDVIAPRQSLASITTRTLVRLEPVLTDRRPAALVVQGDTTSAMAAGLAGFYAKVPVVHLEAGLRTGNRYDPFPEEGNRRVLTSVSSLHLTPTAGARANLLRESVDPADVVVTGNTCIDALLEVAGRPHTYREPRLRDLPTGPLVLVTAHRRESLGEPLRRVARAVARLAERFAETTFVLPAHLNPGVRADLLPALAGRHNIVVTDPLGYDDLAHVLTACAFVITDSGGLQEEAPALGKPVLVVRETTERPEAVVAGTARLIGTDDDVIVAEATSLLTDPVAYRTMARAVNPYGDGRAAGRAVAALTAYFGLGPWPASFEPADDGSREVPQRKAPRVS